METLIVYSTRSGASRECAELLAAKMKSCSLCDLSKQALDIESSDKFFDQLPRIRAPGLTPNLSLKALEK